MNKCILEFYYLDGRIESKEFNNEFEGLEYFSKNMDRDELDKFTSITYENGDIIDQGTFVFSKDRGEQMYNNLCDTLS